MLTSLFYYQHYTPYMLKTAHGKENSDRIKKKEIVTEGSNVKPEVALNKSLNTEIVKFAKGIYKNTTELKYTSKKLETDIGNYSRYKDFEEFDKDAFEQGFKNDLEQFSGSYNKSMRFLKEQPHSSYLGEAADELDRITHSSQKILSVMGIKKNSEGDLEVNGDENIFWNGKNTERKVDAAKKLFSEVNEKTTDVLNDPMSKHMNFKSLNYYYNYKVDKIHVDSFQIVKTGMLVNLAL